VRKQLSKADSEALKAGTAYYLHDQISASQLITMGLDLEEAQYVVERVHVRIV